MSKHYNLGVEGEQLAEAYLLKRDYKILARNWRFQKAEIDIIAKKENTLAVVEVKTRSNTLFGEPQDAVNKKKIDLLARAVNQFVEQNNLDIEVRFDIIAIVKNKQSTKIEHIKDAFFHF